MEYFDFVSTYKEVLMEANTAGTYDTPANPLCGPREFSYTVSPSSTLDTGLSIVDNDTISKYLRITPQDKSEIDQAFTI